eukprot:sb/3468235/
MNGSEDKEFLENITLKTKEESLKRDDSKLGEGLKSDDSKLERSDELQGWNSVMICETLGLTGLWMIVSMSFHGLNFGWVDLVPSPYVAYAISGTLEALSSLLWAGLASSLGRRYGMGLGFGIASVFLFLALIQTPILGTWTVGNFSLLVGKLFVDTVFAGVCLRSGEILPASHFAFIYSIVSSGGRCGAFFAPMIFTVLAGISNDQVPLITVALLQVTGCLISLGLVETKDVRRVITPQDVLERRRSQRLLDCAVIRKRVHPDQSVH